MGRGHLDRLQPNVMAGRQSDGCVETSPPDIVALGIYAVNVQRNRGSKAEFVTIRGLNGPRQRPSILLNPEAGPTVHAGEDASASEHSNS